MSNNIASDYSNSDPDCAVESISEDFQEEYRKEVLAPINENDIAVNAGQIPSVPDFEPTPIPEDASGVVNESEFREEFRKEIGECPFTDDALKEAKDANKVFRQEQARTRERMKSMIKSQRAAVDARSGNASEHPLQDHDFLGDDDNFILNRREKKREEMKEIENNPEAYFERQKIENARSRAKHLLARIKGSTEPVADDVAAPAAAADVATAGGESAPAPDDDDSLVGDISDDGDVSDAEKSVPIVVGGIPDYDEDMCPEPDHPIGVDFLARAGIFINHVDKIIVNVYRK